MGLVLPERLVTCIAWNSDGSNMAVGLQCGFAIYSTELLLRNDGRLLEVLYVPVVGGVGCIALHGQSNLVAVSGWSHDHRTAVELYDLTVREVEGDPEARSVIARAVVPGRVNALCFHPLLVMVGLESGYIYAFDHALENIQIYKTSQRTGAANCAVGKMALATMLDREMAGGIVHSLLRGVILGPTTGTVRCLRYVSGRCVELESSHSFLKDVKEENSGPLEEVVVELHKSMVYAITITAEGRCAVTVSERGTMLKLLDVKRGVVMAQFSRGTTPNTVLTVALYQSFSDTIVACISDSGTLHVFQCSAFDNEARSAEVGGGTSDARQLSIVQRWADYRSSVSSKIRFAIPEDGLCDSCLGSRDGGSTVYNAVIKPHDSSATTIFVVQRCATGDGVSAKARLLSIKVYLSSTDASEEGTSALRSFYFPKNEV
uniref:Uncharacterized protein n=1 Tax=Trypanosoma congolense (strain IL3000) TaxID=1068625 RepID=G0UY00_TRYCI|nr:conserved hypothetical protein [Trypanosoma congolense IL3000]